MRTVLIVDDHQSFRRFARRMLEEGGFRVVGEACDGATALASARALHPDLLLLDVMLPDISGLEVAQLLTRESQRPTVVLTSSRSRSDFGVALESAPIDAFIPKHELTAVAVAAVSVAG